MTITALPDAIGPYRVLRPIARGGMAEVFEVEEPASGEHLACKLLLQTGGALARFNREYEAMTRLNHPNIVRVYHYGLHGDHPWMTMELVDGTPIQAYAKRCGRPGSSSRVDEVVRVSHDLALALDHIHRRGLVHRDLKSANVLVLPDGRVKLIDFGTAKVSEAVEDITREGEFIGTFAYASPEQLTNQVIDHRSDLYSLGVLLYRLATGKRPFNATELHALARQHVKERPRPPRELTPGLPQGLEDVILALLEKDPRHRPQTGADVAAALERVAGHPLFLPGTLDVDQSSERLVGREEQMAQLWGFLDGQGRPTPSGDSPGAGYAAMAIVVGLQGSGRHRVMQALEREVRERGWRPLTWALGRDGDDVGPLLRLLCEQAAQFGASGPDPVIDALDRLEELLEDEHEVSVADRLEAVRAHGAVVLAERARADRAPVVLLVRGLEHSGPVGFEALELLREQLRAQRAQVLVLADCLETADDPSSMARKRLPDALRVALHPLSVRDVALLVGSLLHRRPPPASMARRIWSASGGLPTYVEEVVRGMVARGILRVQSRDANRLEWAQQDEMEIPVPTRAQERVVDQLAQLPADRRRVLEALALAGGTGPVSVLAGALESKPAELTPALHDLALRGWITVDTDHGQPRVAWRQILARQVVLDQLHPCRRRVLERQLIDEVAAEPAFAAQIHLLLQVERLGEAMHRAYDWAVEHIEANQPSTALEVLDEVVPRIEEAPLEPADRARLYLTHVSALLMARPTDQQTSRSLVRATQLAPADDPVFNAELHLTRARIQRVIGHYPNFRKHLMEAWYLIEHAKPSGLGSTVAGLLGWSNRVAGHVDDAATWHGRARRMAVQVGAATVRAHADVGVAGWQYARGTVAQAERTARGAMDIFEQAGDHRGMSLAIPVWAAALRQQGRFSEALAVLYAKLPPMRESEAPSLYVRLLLATAWCEVELARLGRAQECVDELAATLRKGEHLDLRMEADLVWGRILLASGLLDEAQRRLKEVRDRASAAGLAVLAEHAQALLAECRFALGDRRKSVAGFQVALTRLRQAGDLPALGAAVVAHARARAEEVDPDTLFEPLRGWVDEPTVILQLEYTLARGRFLSAQGADATSSQAQARLQIDAIRESLNDTDKAALRLHPWSRQARRR